MLNYEKIKNYFLSKNRGILFLLLLSSCLVYLPHLSNQFFFDDNNFFSQSVKSSFFQTSFDSRFISNFLLNTIWFNFYDAPHFYHLASIILHTINAVLLFHLALFYLNCIDVNPKNKLLALFAALIFSTHPLMTYAVGYVIQLSILLATSFFMLTQLALLKALENQKSGWYLATVIFYFLAIFSKEHAVMIPAVLVGISLLWKNSKSKDILNPKLAFTFLSLLCLALFVTYKLKAVVSVQYEHDAGNLLAQNRLGNKSSHEIFIISILSQCGLFFKYLLLFIFPDPSQMAIDIRMPFNSEWKDSKLIFNGVAYVIYGLFSIKLLLMNNRKLSLIGLTLLTPWLLFFTEFSTVRIQEPFVLYRSYIWFSSFPIIFAILVQKYLNARSTIISVCFLVVSGLALISSNRLNTFSSDYKLWNDAAKLITHDSIPGSSRIFYNRANALISQQKYGLAIADYNRVIALNPEMGEAYLNRGLCFLKQNNYELALVNFDNAIKLKASLGKSYFVKGIALKRLGRSKEAMTFIKKSCDFDYLPSCVILSGKFK